MSSEDPGEQPEAVAIDAIANSYTWVVAKVEPPNHSAEHSFRAYCQEIPSLFSDGPDHAMALSCAMSLVSSYLEDQRENGKQVPAPIASGSRDFQVNVRVNAQERATLLAGAEAADMRLSTYVRTAALLVASNDDPMPETYTRAVMRCAKAIKQTPPGTVG